MNQHTADLRDTSIQFLSLKPQLLKCTMTGANDQKFFGSGSHTLFARGDDASSNPPRA